MITTYTTGISADAQLQALTARPDGSTWVTEGPNDKMARISPSGTVTEFSVGSPDGLGIAGTLAVTTGPGGNIWVTGGFADEGLTMFTGELTKITPSGVMTHYTDGFGGNAATGIDYSLRITSAGGSLWLSFQNSAEVARVSTAGQITGHFATTGTNVPTVGTTDPLHRLGISAAIRLTATADGSIWWSDQNPSWVYGRLSVRDDIGDPCNPDEDGDLLRDVDDPQPFNPHADGDSVKDGSDNCVFEAKSDQADLDGDKLGDVCDTDIDRDGHDNAADVFPRDAGEWADHDGDGIGDNADPDDDNDGTADIRQLRPGRECRSGQPRRR